MKFEDWSTDYELLVKLLHSGVEVICKAVYFDKSNNELIEDLATGHCFEGYYIVKSHSCNFATNLKPETFIEHCIESKVKFQVPWIPVDLALPSKDGRYIGFIQDSNGNQVQELVEFDLYLKRWNYTSENYQRTRPTVTHWRPLHSNPQN